MKQTGADRAQVMPNCTVKKSTAESSFFCPRAFKMWVLFWSPFLVLFWSPFLGPLASVSYKNYSNYILGSHFWVLFWSPHFVGGAVFFQYFFCSVGQFGSVPNSGPG